MARSEDVIGLLQVSADIPWSPHGIDGRNFDWTGLAKAADLLFVMAYDTQSQVREEYHTMPDSNPAGK